MIFEALSIIRTELGLFIESLEDGGGKGDVVLGNIALLENNDAEAINNKIVLSLVNIEEESVLKNANVFHRRNGNLQYENPPVYLNLYLLFSANWADAYDTAVQRLGNTIEFFQGKNIFTIKNSPNAAEILPVNNPEIQEIKLILDMYTLTFEQINHLWGALGGKQIPFVMYKVRLTIVRREHTLRDGNIIKRTQNEANVL